MTLEGTAEKALRAVMGWSASHCGIQGGGSDDHTDISDKLTESEP